MLQTLGTLLLVCGVSYHMARSSWQLVLLSFVVAGVGYAIWKFRKATIRRTKIRALWQRSLKIEAMIAQMEEPAWARMMPADNVRSGERKNVGERTAQMKQASDTGLESRATGLVRGATGTEAGTTHGGVAENARTRPRRRRTCVALDGPAKSGRSAPVVEPFLSTFPIDKWAETRQAVGR